MAQGTIAETQITSVVIIADTDEYDVILGMDFLGACFGYFDPLTERFNWRIDCHETDTMPTKIGQLLATCRASSFRERRHVFMVGEIGCTADLMDATCGDETLEEEFPEVRQSKIDEISPVLHVQSSNIKSFAVSNVSPLIRPLAVHRRHEASARLEVARKQNLQPLLPRT